MFRFEKAFATSLSQLSILIQYYGGFIKEVAQRQVLVVTDSWYILVCSMLAVISPRLSLVFLR